MRRVGSLVLVCSLAGSVGLFSVVGLAADNAKTPVAPEEIQEVVKRIQARYERTRDLQADFTQSTMIEGFATPIVSSGRVYIKKPGRLRWDYLDPAVEQIYVLQNKVMIYVPEHQQVLVGKLTHMAASQAPLQLLQGIAKLDEEFDIVPTSGVKRGEGGIPLITLLPKHQGHESVQAVERIVLGVQPKTYFVKTVSIHEISGNVATFEFTNLRANIGLSNGLFDFDVPDGVEVVDAPALNPP